jgi:hypothetical protein
MRASRASAGEWDVENQAQWREVYDGGSPEAEREIFLALAKDMIEVQEASRKKAGAASPNRTLHAKPVAAVTNATLRFDDDLPGDFRVGFYQPGASLPTTVRFSNASGVPQSDAAPDMRGAALRIALPDGGVHDLLMTSFPASHARNARQFVAFAVIASGPRETLQARLVEAFGEAEARRMAGNIGQGVRPCASFALESFWSRGAILWGEAPVRFQLRPAPDAAGSALEDAAESSPEVLHQELAARLRERPVSFRLGLQRFVDEARTPIEDGAADWELTSPPLEVATLTLPRQELMSEEARRQAAEVERFAFNPWNAPADFRPLGNLNRARAVVYRASAERWGGLTPAAAGPASNSP